MKDCINLASISEQANPGTNDNNAFKTDANKIFYYYFLFSRQLHGVTFIGSNK